MRIGVIANPDKPRAVTLVRQLVSWLAERGIEAVVSPDGADAFADGAPRPLIEPMAAWGGRVRFAVVLGGDGTLLKAARSLAGGGTPLLGVNLGRLGFLSEIEAGSLFDRLPDILDGRYRLEERTMLAAAVLVDGRPQRRILALNDVVVSVAPFARLGILSISVSGSHIGSYPADGVIVATPTGCTAYSLAAGGPIVAPDLDVLVVTPVCPHTFYARPTVIAKEDSVRIRIERSQEGGVVTADGQERQVLAPGEEVVVAVAGEVARLIRSPGWDFYRVLRQKLLEAPGQGMGGGES